MIDSPDFPHGTPAGFDLGCHGTVSCMNHRTNLMTCTEAHIRYQGDYAYRLAVKAGTATAEKEAFTVPKPVRLVLETVEEAQKRPVKRVKPKRKPRVEGPKTKAQAGLKHGIIFGARRCHSDCPNELAGGKSCTQVANEAQRDYWARRKAGGLAIKHGTITGYNSGCHRDSPCPMPAGETCSDVVYAYQEKQARAKGVKKREKAKHGTPTGYTSYRCHVSAECPSKVAGGISCSEAQTAYRVVYRAGLKRSAMEKAA